MLGAKIWAIAQLINAIVCFYCFGDVALFVVPMSLAGGLPAIVFFNWWLVVLNSYNLSSWLRMLLSLVMLPTCTAICAFGLAYLFDNRLRELIPYTLPSIIAIFISTLLLSYDIIIMKREPYDPESI